MSNVNHFSHLRSQVKACLEKEAKLSPNDRKKHQWQFLTTLNGVTYIVGKGGANTMFYSVGNGERKLCHPKEMLDIISSWGKAKYAMYAIGKKRDAYTHGPSEDIDTLLEEQGEPGEYIVGMTSDGKVVRLYEAKKGISSTIWVPFERKK